MVLYCKKLFAYFPMSNVAYLRINGDKGCCSTSAGLLLLLNLTWRDAIDAIDAMANAMAMDAMGTMLPFRANCVDRLGTLQMCNKPWVSHESHDRT